MKTTGSAATLRHWTNLLYPVLGALLLATGVAAIGVSFIALLTTYAPMLDADEWLNWWNLFDRGIAGSIFCKYGDHPMIIPQMFYRVNALVFHGDPLTRASITWTGAAASGIGLSLLTRSQTQAKIGWTAAFSVLLPIVLTTCMAQQREIFWGMSIHDFLPTIGATMMAVGLKRWLERDRKLDATALIWLSAGGIVASYSFGLGLGVWAALPFAWLLATRRLRTFGILFAVGILSACVVVFATPACMTAAAIKPNFLLVPSYTLVIAGKGIASLFVASPTIPQAIGAGIAASVASLLAAYTVWRDQSRTPLLAALMFLILFALADAVLISISRTMFRLGSALHPRFSPVSLLLLAALLLFALVRFQSQRGKLAVAALGMLVCLSALQTNVRILSERQVSHSTHVENAYRLQLTTLKSEQLLLNRKNQPIFAIAATLVLPSLRDRQWDLYEDQSYRLVGQVAAPKSQACTGGFALSRTSPDSNTETIGVSGWARDATGRPARRIVLTSGDRIVGVGRAVIVYGRNLGAGSEGALWAGAITAAHGAPPNLSLMVIQQDGSLCAVGRPL